MNSYLEKLTKGFQTVIYVNLAFHALELFIGGYASFLGGGSLPSFFASLANMTLFSGLAVFALLAIWLIHLQKLMKELRMKTHYSSSSIIGSIIIPFVNLVRPFIIVHSTWNEFRNRVESLGGESKEATPVPSTYIWWGSWILSAVFYALNSIAASSGDINLDQMNYASILSKISLMVSAWYLMMVVNQVLDWKKQINEQTSEKQNQQYQDLDDFMFNN